MDARALGTSGPEGMVTAAVLDRVVEDAGRDGSGKGRAGWIVNMYDVRRRR